MKRVPLILVCLLCLAVGFWFGTVTEHARLLDFLRENGSTVAAITLGGLLVLIVCAWGVLAYARRLARRVIGGAEGMSEAEIVHGLVDHFTTPEGTENPTNEDRHRAALTNLGLWLARRAAVQFSFNATVTVVGGLVGGATLFLLYEQNQKLDSQNRQITLQTDAAIVQSIMLESTRRSTQSVAHQSLFAAIADAPGTTDKTCPEEGPKAACWEAINGMRLFHLPAGLAARVERFAQRSTPYYLAEARDSGGGLNFNNPLSQQFRFRALSPERGQLLETLLANRVVVPRADYNFAVLYSADLAGAVLSGLELNVSDFRRANLSGADLSGSRFQETNFARASLQNANLSDADFGGAFLTSTSFNNTQVTGAAFFGASFDHTLEGTAWAWTSAGLDDLPNSIKLTVCKFDPEKHDRAVMPADC